MQRNPDNPANAAAPLPARRAATAFAAFLAASALLRSPALLRNADNLALDSPRRAPCLAAMRRANALSHALRLDAECRFFEAIERKYLE